MNLSEVAIILGAGAHVPYGFPTAEELRKKILTLNVYAKEMIISEDDFKKFDITRAEVFEAVNIKFQLINILRDSEIIKNKLLPYISTEGYWSSFNAIIVSFIDSFARSQAESIDYFISRNSSDEIELEVGRIMIGVVLNNYEMKQNIGFDKFDWIQTMINKYIRDDFEAFFRTPPTFITFNYDRLLEHSIVIHLMHHHRLDHKAALSCLEKLNIYHVYGDLGPIGGTTFPRFNLSVANNIKVIRGRDDIQMRLEIFNKLRIKSKIYLLGFGFDKINTDILFGQLLKSGWEDAEHRITASIRSLSEYDQNEFRIKAKNTEVNFFKKDIVEILRTEDSLEKDSKSYIKKRDEVL